MATYKPIPTFDAASLASFWSRVDKLSNIWPGCWLWTGKRSPSGYGYFREYRAHRIAFVALRGPISETLQLDHLCRNRRCVNPAHLEIVTNKVNALRGVSVSATNAKKTHCRAGHEYTPDNTRINRWNRRECRACYALRLQNRKAHKTWTTERRNRKAREIQERDNR